MMGADLLVKLTEDCPVQDGPVVVICWVQITQDCPVQDGPVVAI